MSMINRPGLEIHNQSSGSSFFPDKWKVLFLSLVGIILISVAIAGSQKFPINTEKKIQQTIANADGTKLSTIAVTTMPIIIVLKEKLYIKEK